VGVAVDKKALRRQMRDIRKKIGNRAEKDNAICDAILKDARFVSARAIFAYAASDGEPDLTAVLRSAIAAGKRVALPVCEKNGRMYAAQVTRMEELSPDRFGILSPGEDAEKLRPEEIDLVLVPGCAFSPKGARIGRGAGFYDRFLAACGAYRMGVCYDEQITQEIPVDEHDVFMHGIVTPGGVRGCGEDS